MIATVASSSSLGLLAITGIIGKSYPYLGGVLFALAGFTYRELTLFSIDREDVFKVARLVGVRITKTTSRFQFWAKQIRRVGLRMFLLLPVAFWMNYTSETVKLFHYELVLTIPKVTLT